MENVRDFNRRLVADMYQMYGRDVYYFICRRTGCAEDAKDLAQDTFLKLMEYDTLLCAKTAKSFVMTVAANMVTDYLRRHYKKKAIDAYLYDTLPTAYTHVESNAVANDLREREKMRLDRMPARRKKIYCLNRFRGYGNKDISKALGLSLRTVETHLYISRKEMREYMNKCI